MEVVWDGGRLGWRSSGMGGYIAVHDHSLVLHSKARPCGNPEEAASNSRKPRTKSRIGKEVTGV